MNFSSWLGQVTTGLGAAGLTGAAIAAGTGQISLTQAATAIGVSLVLAAWPEKPAYATAMKDVIARLPALFAAYVAGGPKAVVVPGLQMVEQVAGDLLAQQSATAKPSLNIPPPPPPQPPLSGV